MPMPRWWAQINKRLFNPGAVERGNWPVLRHVGRSSGHIYRTPLGAHSFDGGYVFVIVYGPETDWVQNVMKSGRAVLEIDGDEVELDSPRLVPLEEAFAPLPPETKRPPRLLRISLCLVMDTSARRAAAIARAERRT